jgi:hypothetical protein
MRTAAEAAARIQAELAARRERLDAARAEAKRQALVDQEARARLLLQLKRAPDVQAMDADEAAQRCRRVMEQRLGGAVRALQVAIAYVAALEADDLTELTAEERELAQLWEPAMYWAHGAGLKGICANDDSHFKVTIRPAMRPPEPPPVQRGQLSLL